MKPDHFVLNFNNPLPLVAAAIHDGHKMRRSLLNLTGLSEATRLREEDPFTSVWTRISGNRIIGRRSRFEYDLNRSPEKAIYLVPEDAWGLQVWKRMPEKRILDETMEAYYDFYEKVYDGISGLIDRFGKIVVLDIHSYNHRRGGPGTVPEDQELNPELNIGTGTMNRDYWAPLLDQFMEDLRTCNFMGRQLDVRENVKFKGGYFPKWIHENFPDRACCISVEVKKFFMDEWTGKPDWDLIIALSDALSSTLPGLFSALALCGETNVGRVIL